MDKYLPYSCQDIDETDIQSVVDVLRSDWITTGPAVNAFEKTVADFVGAKYSAAVSSGTAALHAAMYAIGIGVGDEIIVPSMTFVATANTVVFQGATPVFCDIDADTLLIDPDMVKKRINSKTKAIIAVDYAGQPCDYDALIEIAKNNHIILVADACHSIGAKYKERKIGTLADLTVFSFHPVKNITTGEGGMVITDKSEYIERIKTFRNHGITSDNRQRAKKGVWFYEMVDLGYNYRITDFQCALGISQLKKLPYWIKCRQEIAAHYNESFNKHTMIKPLYVSPHVYHAYHLYVVRVANKYREKVFKALRNEAIGANIHYIPVHLHPFYRKRFGTREGLSPVAEKAFQEIISLPVFPGMKSADVERVIGATKSAVNR